MASLRTPIERRLSSYWKMELVNIMLVPAGLILVGQMFGAKPGWLTGVGVLPNMILLAVGGFYWRAKLHRIQGRPQSMAQFLPIAERCRMPAALLTGVAVVVVALAWSSIGPSSWLGDRVLATILAASAVAELANYYWRQLQHFDRRADLVRLLRGQGFRPAHLARDLARWRQARS